MSYRDFVQSKDYPRQVSCEIRFVAVAKIGIARGLRVGVHVHISVVVARSVPLPLRELYIQLQACSGSVTRHEVRLVECRPAEIGREFCFVRGEQQQHQQ